MPTSIHSLADSTRRARSRGVLVAIALVLAASGCGGGSSSGDSVVDEATTPTSTGPTDTATPTPDSEAPTACRADTFTFALPAASPTLDPASVNQALSTFLQPAYEPLIRRAPSGDYVPGLAVKWGYVGEGNAEFTLTLRDGVTFSDGGELTAEGVKQHLEYMQKSVVNGGLLAGATFEVTGPLDLTMKLANPNPMLEELLSQDWVIGLVISPKALADPAALATSTAGAGAYVLDTDATVSGDTYVYTANPNYFDPTQVYFDTMILKVIANPNSTLNALQTGEIDAAVGDYTTADAARSAGLQVAAQPTVWQGLGLFDRNGTLSAPLADQRVRQAINYAIDREAVTKALYGADGVASSEVALPGSPDHNDESADLYSYDPEKARQLLAEAGYPDGFTLKTVSTPFGNISLAGQAIAAQLEKVGIKLELDEQELNSYVGSVLTGQAPAAVVGLGSPPVYISATVALQPASPFNPFHTEDAQLADLYKSAAAASGDERIAIDREIVARVQELAWFVPVTYTPVYVYAATKFGGIELSERNRLQNPMEIYSTEC